MFRVILIFVGLIAIAFYIVLGLVGFPYFTQSPALIFGYIVGGCVTIYSYTSWYLRYPD